MTIIVDPSIAEAFHTCAVSATNLGFNVTGIDRLKLEPRQLAARRQRGVVAPQLCDQRASVGEQARICHIPRLPVELPAATPTERAGS